MPNITPIETKAEAQQRDDRIAVSVHPPGRTARDPDVVAIAGDARVITTVASAAAAIHHCKPRDVVLAPSSGLLTSTVNGSSQKGAIAVLADDRRQGSLPQAASLSSLVGDSACATGLSSAITPSMRPRLLSVDRGLVREVNLGDHASPVR